MWRRPGACFFQVVSPAKAVFLQARTFLCGNKTKQEYQNQGNTCLGSLPLKGVAELSEELQSAAVETLSLKRERGVGEMAEMAPLVHC